MSGGHWVSRGYNVEVPRLLVSEIVWPGERDYLVNTCVDIPANKLSLYRGSVRVRRETHSSVDSMEWENAQARIRLPERTQVRVRTTNTHGDYLDPSDQQVWIEPLVSLVYDYWRKTKDVLGERFYVKSPYGTSITDFKQEVIEVDRSRDPLYQKKFREEVTTVETIPTYEDGAVADIAALNTFHAFIIRSLQEDPNSRKLVMYTVDNGVPRVICNDVISGATVNLHSVSPVVSPSPQNHPKATLHLSPSAEEFGPTAMVRLQFYSSDKSEVDVERVSVDMNAKMKFKRKWRRLGSKDPGFDRWGATVDARTYLNRLLGNEPCTSGYPWNFFAKTAQFTGPGVIIERADGTITPNNVTPKCEQVEDVFITGLRCRQSAFIADRITELLTDEIGNLNLGVTCDYVAYGFHTPVIERPDAFGKRLF